MSVYANGFARVAGAVPVLTLAEPAVNAARTVELATQAADDGACLVVFPELGLCGYSVDDLFHQDALLDGCRTALDDIVTASAGLKPVLCVGLPMRVGDGLYNCAAVIHDGAVLGVVPKSYLPNYREFYEQRFFAAARDAVPTTVRFGDVEVPFGADLVFEARDLPGFALFVEICEDGWVAIPPSTWAALGGATVLANLSGSPVTIGKESYRTNLCTGHSARTISAHVYVAAGYGE